MHRMNTTWLNMYDLNVTALCVLEELKSLSCSISVSSFLTKMACGGFLCVCVIVFRQLMQFYCLSFINYISYWKGSFYNNFYYFIAQNHRFKIVSIQLSFLLN